MGSFFVQYNFELFTAEGNNAATDEVPTDILCRVVGTQHEIRRAEIAIENAIRLQPGDAELEKEREDCEVDKTEGRFIAQLQGHASNVWTSNAICKE